MGPTTEDKIRILFITQDDPFYVRLFFEEFFKNYARRDEIVGVVIAEAMGKKSMGRLARQMFGFYGLKDFVKVGIKFASYKVMAAGGPFMPAGKHYSLTQLCRGYGIEVLHGSDVNGKAFLDRVRALRPDLIVSVAAPVIFKRELISLPRLGCINIHNGMLPRYRGMLPNFWQMYHDEKQVGITVHEINENLDDGRILVQEKVDILPHETLDSLIRRTKLLDAHILARAIAALRDGTVAYRDNPASEGSYFSFPTSEHVREFKRNGKRLI
jgi:methionyl-tRNA formyltransferase